MNNDYVKEVAGRIIEQLKQGTAPWQKPWKPGELRLPYNAATGKEYRGMNSLWLHMQGYSDPRWMTVRQANGAGAKVRKGSKGTRVVYWKFFDDVPLKDDNGRPVLDDDGKPKTVRVELEKPRVFGAVVFNAEQIEGLPPLEAKATGPEPERHARAEAILANSGAKISHVAGDRAFYRPSTDSITLPERQQFSSADAYYATALHELGHWTGHPSRLDRDLSHPFGSAGYAREELRAEIASLMLGERLEIGHDPGQHVAYVAAWIKALEEDPREIFRAATDAERITRYVMEFELEQQAERGRGHVLDDGDRLAVEAVAETVLAYERWRNGPHEDGNEELDLETSDSLNMALDERVKAAFAKPALAAALNASGFTIERLMDLGGDRWAAAAGAVSAMSALPVAPQSPQASATAQPVSSVVVVDYAPTDEMRESKQVAIYAGEDASLVLMTGPVNDPASHHRARKLVADPDFRRLVRDAIPDTGGIIGAGTHDEGTGGSAAYPDRMTALAREGAETQPVAVIYMDGEKGRAFAQAMVSSGSIQRAFAPDVVPEIGERVTFTPYEASATEQAVTGVVVDIASTSGGNRRYRIRTDEIAPQDGDRQEWLVYSHQGTLERHLAHPIPAMAPEVAKSLDRDHQNAVPTYSPLETWQNLEAGARQLGLVASIRLNPETDVAAGHARYLVSYSRENGEPTTIGTGIFPDGKAVTGVLNRRISPFITEDHDSQRDDLQTALMHENARERPVLHGAPEASTMTQTRTYLAVPYREKNAAKALGARWDKEAKAWYAPEGVDVQASGLAKWLPEQRAMQPAQVDTPEVAFAAALQAAGLEVKGTPIMDGNLHRVPVKGDRGGETSGAYVGHLEGRCPAGFIQNYRTGERVNWKHEGPVPSISAEERARLDREAAERLERRAAETAAQYERVSHLANLLWDEAPPATADHPYCVAKGIDRPGDNGLRVVPATVSDDAKAAGIRIAKNVKSARAIREAEPDARVFIAGDLLVPAMDIDGKIWSLQTINTRFKGYVKGGRKAGLFTVAGAKPEEYLAHLDRNPSTPLVQAEGYATADTVSRLTDGPVIVAFDSGNLQAVAEQFRERYPERAILIASDNDHQTARQLRPDGTPMPNVGVEKAKATAEAVGAGVMTPPFAEADEGSDWNDFCHQYGENVARRALMQELAKATVEAAVTLERRLAADSHKENERAISAQPPVTPAPQPRSRGYVAAL